MRVRIGERWYSAEDEPLAIELNEGERAQIAAMGSGVRVYCQFPDRADGKRVAEWAVAGSRIDSEGPLRADQLGPSAAQVGGGPP